MGRPCACNDAVAATWNLRFACPFQCWFFCQIIRRVGGIRSSRVSVGRAQEFWCEVNASAWVLLRACLYIQLLELDCLLRVVHRFVTWLPSCQACGHHFF